MILPHAGTFFIKDTLDYCFDQIDKNNFDRIILLSTNHYDNNNYILPNNIDKIKYNDNFLITLQNIESKYTIESTDFFFKEHSYLSVLPYIQKFEIPLTIILVGNANKDFAIELQTIINDMTLLIANTDLLHCGEGFNEPCPENIEEYNINIIKNIINNKTNDNMCGKKSIDLFCRLNKKLYTEYTYTSSDRMQISSSSVGYTGILYNKNGIPDLINNTFLSTIPKQFLYDYFNGNDTKFKIKIFIKDIVGIFVTIKKNNNLRGCIGTFEIRDDIIDSIIEYTKKSAFNDSRFNNIIKEEFDELTFHINFLKKSFSVKESDIFRIFEPKIHGITLYFSDDKSATYLASVIPEHFGVNTKNDFKSQYDNIKEELKNKANSFGKLSRIELYECIEI